MYAMLKMGSTQQLRGASRRRFLKSSAVAMGGVAADLTVARDRRAAGADRPAAAAARLTATCSPESLKKLAKFDTPTICNAMELYHRWPPTSGYMDGRIRANFPELPPMVGFACTAASRGSMPPEGQDVYSSLMQQIETFAKLPGPAVVAIQDVDDPPVSANFGEVMCSAYQAFGSAGLITSGAGRDIQQVRRLRYPVFSNSTICSHGHCHLLHLGRPVRIGGLTIHQGDLLHGDVNGITRIPLEIADELPDVAAEFVAAEKILIEYLQSPGSKTTRGHGEAHGETAKRIQALKRRLQRT